MLGDDGARRGEPELRAIVLSGMGESPTPGALDAAFGYLLSALGNASSADARNSATLSGLPEAL
ncbi:MAG: hypothetical protein R3E51_08485 [Rhizobiaceae bacterium]